MQNVKCMKRVLTIVFLLAVILGCVIFRTFAAEVVASGYCGGEGDGTNLSWTLDSNGVLTISGGGAMKDYGASSSNYSPWKWMTDVKTVVISSGVTSIGRCAFYFCDWITSVTIPNSIKTIGSNAFRECKGLKEINISDSVTTIGSQAFSGCSSLTEIVIPNSVTNIGDAVLARCSNLQGVTIGHGITAITDAMFSRCSSLREITILNNITRIGGWAFEYCTALKGVYFIGNPPSDYSFPLEVTFYYIPGTTGWTDSDAYDAADGTWNGYKLATWNPYIHNIVGQIPAGQYAVLVMDSGGEPLEGVTVTWNNDSAVTPDTGVVFFEKHTVGEPLITAKKDNYISYNNQNKNFEKSENGYTIITLYTIAEGKYRLSDATYKSVIGTTENVLIGTKRLSLSNGSDEFSLYCSAMADDITNYILLQSDETIAEAADGNFTNLTINQFEADKPVSVAVVSAAGKQIKTSINLQFVDDRPINTTGFQLGGESLSFTVGENVPFVGGRKLNFAWPYTPVDIFVSEDTIHLGVNVDISDEDHDSCEKKIQKLKGLIGTIQHMQKTETRTGQSIGKTMQKEINFLMKDKNQKAKWGPVDTSLSFIGYGEGKFDEAGRATNITVYL